MVTIKIDGEDVDVSECAVRSCGQMPRKNMMTGISMGRPKSAADRAASMEETKKWFACVNSKCHPTKPKLVSAPVEQVTQTVPSGNGSRSQSSEESLEEGLEEGWFKRNQTWVILGGSIIVLSIGGLITYKALKS